MKIKCDYINSNGIKCNKKAKVEISYAGGDNNTCAAHIYEFLSPYSNNVVNLINS